jgi:hypothetical protein
MLVAVLAVVGAGVGEKWGRVELTGETVID